MQSLGPMITSIARFKSNDSNNNGMPFSIEDLGIPRMFAEVMPSMFYHMGLYKSATSFLPKINLIDIFNQTIIKKINNLRTERIYTKVNEGLDISYLIRRYLRMRYRVFHLPSNNSSLMREIIYLFDYCLIKYVYQVNFGKERSCHLYKPI